MKISLDLNPRDLFGKDAPFASHWQNAPYPESAIPEVMKEHYPRPKTLALAFLLLLSFFALIESAQYSVSGKFLTPDLLRGPAYGPTFERGHFLIRDLNFNQTGRSFSRQIPLWRLSEFKYSEIRAQILEATPAKMRVRLEKYIDYAFYYAQTYQVDPYWVLSIMWVESHFKPEVKSRVDAMGLMQLMPGTAHYLNHLLDRPITSQLAIELSKDPAHNIQLGTFYLSRLLQRFKGSHVYATVSYNMGPGFTLRRLKMGRPVGTQNRYLNKVRKAYERLSSGIRKRMRYTPPLYTTTYVSLNMKNTLPDASFRLLSWWNSEIEDYSSKVSQNNSISGVVRL